MSNSNNTKKTVMVEKKVLTKESKFALIRAFILPQVPILALSFLFVRANLKAQADMAARNVPQTDVITLRDGILVFGSISVIVGLVFLFVTLACTLTVNSYKSFETVQKKKTIKIIETSVNANDPVPNC